jgi:circadian clock protein KaiB
MPLQNSRGAAAKWDETTSPRQVQSYVLRLYITGATPRSTRAIQNVRRICEQYLLGRYELEVVDVYQQPTLAQKEQLIAAPTLIKELPLPLRKIIGDMSNEGRVLLGLDLHPQADSTLERATVPGKGGRKAP